MNISETKSILIKILRAVRIEEWVAIGIACIATFVNVFLYHNRFSVAEVLLTMMRYFTFGKIQTHSQMLTLTIIAIFFIASYLVIVNIIARRYIYREFITIKSFRPLGVWILWLFRTSMLIVIVSIPIYMLLSNLNYNLRFSGTDMLLASFEQHITGTILTLYLPHIMTYAFLDTIVIYSYTLLGVVMGATLALLALRKKWVALFRGNLLAFIFSLSISFLIFPHMPCQDPNHYFIRNIRGNTFPPHIERQLDAYTPSQSVQSIITQIGDAEYNERRDTVPISCFPSMHVVWAMLVAYFLARLSRWTLIISIPWVIALATGGLLLAQHYLIDYVASLPVAMLSLWLAHGALKLEKIWREPKTTSITQDISQKK